MKVYVFAEALASKDEYADIAQTKVFLNIEDAKEYLKRSRDFTLYYPDDENKWKVNYESDTYCHLVYNNGDEYTNECVMAIEEHEI